MIDLELERKKLELRRVEMSKDEMGFKIFERQADIERLKKEIEKQTNRVEELKQQIEGWGK